MTSNPTKTGTVWRCLATAGLFLSLAHSAHAGLWLTNSAMLTTHSGGTATLLQNGKVLIVGGEIDGDTTATAELFEPATGSWKPVGSLHMARTGHCATLLRSGQVLVAGGFSDNYLTGLIYINNAELYDPVSETWTETGPLQTARYDFTATLLPDGKVLVAGGANTVTNTATAELYDPASGSWTPTENLNQARAYHTATLLPDGQVMVSGGTSNSFFVPGTRSSIELYNPAQGTWTLGGTMFQARLGHTATLLPNGKVLLAGGITNGPPSPPTTPFSSTEIYDPLTGSSSPAASMHSTRAFQTATLLPNGSLLVAGGITDHIGNGSSDGSATNSTEIYDPSADSWTLTGALNTPRFAHRAVLLPSGQILAVGGGTNENEPGLSSTELFDPTISPSTGSWNFTGSMQNAREDFTATLLPNGKILVTGGNGAPNDSACELYDPFTGTWASTGSLNYGRFNHNATLLTSGKVLVTGTFSFSPTPSELYDPAAGIWTTNGLMIGFTYADSATLLRNGKVLVAGDNNAGISAQLFNPNSGTWTATGPMMLPRKWHKAVSLPNGKVFVVGGEANSTNLSSAEIYDPITGQWSAAGATRASSYVFTAAALLPSGKVLVAGADINANSMADLFDPSTGAWNATGAPRTNHFLPSLIVLPGGKALMVGESSAPELYDPASGKWTSTPPMKQQRQHDRAVLLPDGRFMDIGGDAASGATAEIYDPGLYPANSPRPQINSATSTLNLGDSLAIAGTGFRGISEASSGNWQNSASDYPLLQLRSIESGQITFVLATNWSTNFFASVPVWNFPPGETLATVFVNGIQSTSSVVNIAVPTPIATTLLNPQRSTNGAFQFTFTNAPGAMLGILASTNLALPVTNWTPLSGVTEISPGEFEFTDPQATNSVQRFYQIFAP